MGVSLPGTLVRSRSSSAPDGVYVLTTAVATTRSVSIEHLNDAKPASAISSENGRSRQAAV